MILEKIETNNSPRIIKYIIQKTRQILNQKLILLNV